MLIVSNFPVRKSDYSVLSSERLQKKYAGKGMGMAEKLPIGHLTTTGPKKRKTQCHDILESISLLSTPWAFISFSPDHRETNSHLYTS